MAEMSSVQGSTYIDCPIDDVYDIAFVDVEGVPDWMVSVKSVDSVDDNWPEVGSSHTYTGLVMNHTFLGRTTVTSADPPNCVEMSEETYLGEISGEPVSRGQSLWLFEEQGRGTKVTIRLMGGKQTLLSWLIWNLIGRRRVERNLQNSLANLKRICEEEMAAEASSPGNAEHH